ncbi:MAG: glycosyltransferase family 9 protein [Verrucomicrobiota bacterium]
MKISIPKLAKNLPEFGTASDITIFPSSVFGNRTYHPFHWRRVVALLRKALPAASIVIAWNAHSSFPKELEGCAPVRLCDSMHHAAALIQKSQLVLGMDSGPMHVAGMLGVQGLAAIGPVSGQSVFGHFPTIQPIQGKMKCAPRGFQASRGYRPKDCGKWCSSLNSISPDRLAETVKRTFKAAIPTLRPTRSRNLAR